MIKLIKELVMEKREYKSLLERANTLPPKYQFVFNKISEYIWQSASGTGKDTLNIQSALLDLFAEGANLGIDVIELTGEDVASFCDDLIIDTNKWTDFYARRLNKKVAKQIKKRTK